MKKLGAMVFFKPLEVTCQTSTSKVGDGLKKGKQKLGVKKVCLERRGNNYLAPGKRDRGLSLGGEEAPLFYGEQGSSGQKDKVRTEECRAYLVNTEALKIDGPLGRT